MQKRLVGGSRDGQTVLVEWWQYILYFQKQLPVEVVEKYYIDKGLDEFTMWRLPDEVYEYSKEFSVFVHTKTIIYNIHDPDYLNYSEN